MSLGKKRLTILALIASLLISSASINGQTATASTYDWSRLTAVQQRSKLVIKLKNGKTVKGKLIEVSDTGVSISVKDKPLEFKRNDVRSVYLVVGKSARTPTLIGLGVGAGAGAAAGGAATAGDNFGSDRHDKAFTAGLTVFTAGAGALIGYFIGKGRTKRVLIYESNEP